MIHLYLFITICVLSECQLQSPEDIYADIINLGEGKFVAEYTWFIDNIFERIAIAKLPENEESFETILSEEFYIGKPGYKARLSLSPYKNNTKDGTAYVGLWMTLVPGEFDEILEWPFQLAFNLTLLDQYQLSANEDYYDESNDLAISINPLTSICRLLHQFTRPYGQKKGEDGCGKAFFIPHIKLFSEDRYVVDGGIAVKLTVLLNGKDNDPKRAQVKMRGHELVSEFFWKISDIETKINEVDYEETRTIKSDLFYINSESYLMGLHLLINSRDRHLGLYATLMPGDYDDNLEWPFPYTYEISIVDQSPGYLTSDRKGFVTPTTGSCPLSSFTRPKLSAGSPCGFRKMMDFKKINTRNYIKNGEMIVKLTVILDKLPKYGSISVHDGYLVSEHRWSIPHVDRKVLLGKSGKLTNLLSDKFYTSGQGYLMQLQLRLQKSKHGHIGLFMSILEGEYDNMVTWPFNKKFSLSIVDQQANGTNHDATITVDPAESTVLSKACRGSFWRPFGRNDGCGSSTMISYDTLNTRRYIRYGAMLIKLRVYLEPIIAPKIASTAIRDGILTKEYSWKVNDIVGKIRAADAGEVEFFDSKRFYVTSDGYRMIIRLYPSKEGHLGLYAALVKGSNDENLRWPFQHKYQLSIVGQNSGESNKNIVHTTYPTILHDGCPRTAFDRPKRDIAEWSCGEGHLISHSALLSSEFMRHDSIVVKITVFLDEYLPQISSTNFQNSVLSADYAWFIENAKSNLDMLRYGILRRLESPVFYTANQGYAVKMILVLGNGSQFEMIGLYFVITKGKYDSALTWPFKNKINITIVDQTTSSLDISRTIDPQQTKCPRQTFQKPKDFHKNRLCGFPSLISYNELLSFVYDGKLIIKSSILLGAFS